MAGQKKKKKRPKEVSYVDQKRQGKPNGSLTACSRTEMAYLSERGQMKSGRMARQNGVPAESWARNLKERNGLFSRLSWAALTACQ